MNNFDAIIGYDREKDELKQICDTLKRREHYASFGVKPPKGVLLEGVPGVGKTMMAWALIDGSGLKYYHVKKDKPDGEFVKSITQAFEDAKANAPSLIFLDDVDKFAEQSGRDNANQEEFVAIQTGMELIRDCDVMVIATANEISYLPESLRRNGRFDKIISVTFPTGEDAIKIIDHYLEGKRVAKNVQGKYIAKMMTKCSCATLSTVLNEAGIYAAYNDCCEISFEHITAAIARIVGNINLYEHPCSRKELERTAYHEAGHAVMAMLSKGLEPTLSTVCKYDGKRGVCFYDMNKGDYTDFTLLEERIMCALGGRAAEMVQFGEIFPGGISDNEHAYSQMEELLTQECMLGYKYAYFKASWDERVSRVKMDAIENRISESLEEYFNKAKMIIMKHKKLLDRVADGLMEKRVLSIVEFEQILAETDD